MYMLINFLFFLNVKLWTVMPVKVCNNLVIWTLNTIFFTVNTIALAKPEKAKMVENMLVQMTQTGQIQSKVNAIQWRNIWGSK